jgi:TATA-binding protein-associated factor Taf7
MSASTRVGAAVATGYVLGRFRKMRLALIVGSALANRNVRAAGMDFIRGQSGGRTTSPIVDAGRSAVIAAASTSMDRLSDRLHERRAALGGVQEQEDEDYEDEPLDEDEEPADEDEDFDEEEDENLDEEEDRRSSRRRRTAAPGRA